MGQFINKSSSFWKPPTTLTTKAAISTNPALNANQTIAESARVMFQQGAEAVAQATQQVSAVIKDAVATQPTSAHLASALSYQPNLQIQDAQGQKTEASRYLNANELKLVAQLPPHLQRQLLSVNSSQPVGEVRQQIQTRLQSVINQLVSGQSGGAEVVSFKNRDNRAWELESLLGVATSIQRLPLSQQRQLAGVSFVRAAQPELAPGFERHLIANMATTATAGEYDIQSKSVVLFDRGVQDSFPAINQNLKHSLRAIDQKGHSEEIRQLQKLLNPYLSVLNQPTIAEDGDWGAKTAQGLRIVQIELMARHAQSHYRLTPDQQKELNTLRTLAASPQFDMINHMTDIKGRMQNLQLLPDPHMKQLLSEFVNSDFGENSLRFLIQDISNDFRTSPQVTRVEEIMTHEMGHHFQLGLKNESYYISEFSKLSNWRETANNNIADGYVSGVYSTEDLLDVYNVLASDGQQDQGRYRAALSPDQRSQRFVSNYAATDPMEDFAESYKTFVLEPAKLMKASPEKFFFINALPAIQAQGKGKGELSYTHYLPSSSGESLTGGDRSRPTIETIVREVLREQYRQEPTDAHVQDFIRKQFNQMLRPAASTQTPALSREVVTSITSAHKSLLDEVGISLIAAPKTRAVAKPDADQAVLKKLHEQTLRLIVSQNSDSQAKNFFSRFSKPGEVDKLFPEASDKLKRQLKDPAFSAMFLAMGQIGGYAHFLNRVQGVEIQDQQAYKSAQGYFSRVMETPSALMSTQVFGQTWNYLRGLGSEVYNPEASKVSRALDFFTTLETNPKLALPDVWDQLPPAFQEKLYDRRFLNDVSGNQGRYLPSEKDTQALLDQLIANIEFQRRLEEF